ncbi:MAG TPA: LacI family transcriptional regulator, partial [Ruminococcaceae bacterium]|nr:LacI family transcriptional regulator [Oscillospiraceae bacterium]
FKVEAENSGYDIIFINKNIGKIKMSYYEHCKYRDIDGVVIACVSFTDPDVVELVNSDIPVVTIDHVFNNRTAIISDNISGMRDLVNYVYQKGHRKIAYIHGNKSSVNENRLASFYKTADELGIQIPENYVCEASYYDPITTKKVTAELLKLKNRPTCIIFPDDFSAIGGICAIEEAGLAIPDDISAVGYDGIFLSQVINPKLTTLEQDTRRIGREAAAQLVKLIEKPRTTLAERIVIPGRLLPGGSVKQL